MQCQMAITLKNIRRAGIQPTKTMTNQYELRQHRMSTQDIQDQLNLMRLAYRDRDMEPLNRRRFQPIRWVSYGIVIGAILAAITYL